MPQGKNETITLEQRELIQQAWKTLEPHVIEQGYELVELEFGRQGKTPVLRAFIDKEGGGISLDDCTAVSQVLSPVLDQEDLIPDHYMLEVSSPGVDRPLRKPNHFVRFTGAQVRVKSLAPVAGRSRFTGTLVGFEDGLIRLECDGQPCAIHIENLKSARLDR
ncbi:MAG: ribosome maturation factor RimP [Candidatus Hydrogenedentota bacterium]